MVHEYGCSQGGAPFRFSPDSDSDINIRSPEYRPVNRSWRPIHPVDEEHGPRLNSDTSMQRPISTPRGPAQPLEVVFRPGVQLEGADAGPDAMEDIMDRVTNMDIDETAQGTGSSPVPLDARVMAAQAEKEKDPVAHVKDRYEVMPVAGREEDAVEDAADQGEVDAYASAEQDEADAYASFAASMFKPTPAQVLQRPEQSAPVSTRSRKQYAAPSRSSKRQAERPSAVPVAERAQLKLMRDLDFVNNSKTPAPDAAVTAYIDSYGHDLLSAAVKVLRAATKMGNKELSRVLEAIAAEVGTAELEAA